MEAKTADPLKLPLWKVSKWNLFLSVIFLSENHQAISFMYYLTHWFLWVFFHSRHLRNFGFKSLTTLKGKKQPQKDRQQRKEPCSLHLILTNIWSLESAVAVWAQSQTLLKKMLRNLLSFDTVVGGSGVYPNSVIQRMIMSCQNDLWRCFLSVLLLRNMKRHFFSWIMGLFST